MAVRKGLSLEEREEIRVGIVSPHLPTRPDLRETRGSNVDLPLLDSPTL